MNGARGAAIVGCVVLSTLAAACEARTDPPARSSPALRRIEAGGALTVGSTRGGITFALRSDLDDGRWLDVVRLDRTGPVPVHTVALSGRHGTVCTFSATGGVAITETSVELFDGEATLASASMAEVLQDAEPPEGVACHARAADDVWIAATFPFSTVRLAHFDGTSWTLELTELLLSAVDAVAVTNAYLWLSGSSEVHRRPTSGGSFEPVAGGCTLSPIDDTAVATFCITTGVGIYVDGAAPVTIAAPRAMSAAFLAPDDVWLVEVEGDGPTASGVSVGTTHDGLWWAQAIAWRGGPSDPTEVAHADLVFGEESAAPPLSIHVAGATTVLSWDDALWVP